MTDAPAIARLRAGLAMQVSPPLVVSAGPQQYAFSADSAAYAEIDIKRGADFAVVVVIGSLPFEQFVVDVWHYYAPEVWLVDPSEQAVYVARKDAPGRRVGAGELLKSGELPGVAIVVDALFELPS